MHRLVKRLLFTLAGALLAAWPALAHETVVKPGAEAAAPGDGLADQEVLRSTLTFFVK